MNHADIWNKYWKSKHVYTEGGGEFSTFCTINLDEGANKLSVSHDVTLRLTHGGHAAQLSIKPTSEQMRQMAAHLLEMADHLDNVAIDQLMEAGELLMKDQSLPTQGA